MDGTTVIVKDDCRIDELLSIVEWDTMHRTIKAVATYLGVTPSSLEFAVLEPLDPLPDLGLRLPEYDDTPAEKTA